MMIVVIMIIIGDLGPTAGAGRQRRAVAPGLRPDALPPNDGGRWTEILPPKISQNPTHLRYIWEHSMCFGRSPSAFHRFSSGFRTLFYNA